jgi:tetratricopeptide (TPR) repeat protein
LKQFDKSATLFEEVLSRKAEKFGREHPETQLTVGNLGVTYKDAGRLAEAIPLLEEVYLSSAAHPNMRWIRPHLLEAYVKAGKTAEAKKFLNEQEKEIRLRLPKESPRLATALVQFSLTLLQLKAYTDAEPIIRECLAIRERTQPNEWPAFNARTLLGQALLGQRRYAEAEPLLLQGYEGLKQRENSIPPPYKERLPKAADQLIDLYAALGKSKDVAVWRAERAKYRVE